LALSEAGYEVIVVDDLSTGHADALLNGEQLLVENLSDEAALDRVFAEHAPSAVMHFAASIVLPESVSNPLDYYENNTVNTLKLLRACIKYGVKRFVFSSTAAVYGPGRGKALAEDDPTNPDSPYGRSKLMDEWILRDVGNAHGLRYTALRYFNVAGADTKGRLGQRTRNATHLVKVACEAALGIRPALTIYGDDYATPDGTGVRDYIHVEDLASAHLAALRYLEGDRPSVVLNCGYGRGFSVREVIDAVRRAASSEFPVHIGPRRPGDVGETVAACGLLRRTLDWTPRHDDLNSIVRSAFAWERKLASR
jgi:UDP-glucose 4-epimerase